MNTPPAQTVTTDLAVFDLDQTLLAADSDYLWGRFLIDTGHVAGDQYEAANDRFYADYLAGRLDIQAFCRFALEPLTRLAPGLRERLRREFVEQRIRPVIAPGAAALLAHHRKAGHRILITTSTNRFVVAPIAALLGVDDVLATEPEVIDGRYTGTTTDLPNFQAGKVTRLRRWMAAQSQAFAQIHAYSDSHNDLPLLEAADWPTAVDPDDRLRATAQQRGWPIISLR